MYEEVTEVKKKPGREWKLFSVTGIAVVVMVLVIAIFVGGYMYYGSFRTFGGTERNVNGVYSIENTAVIETWFRPDIKANCRVYVPQNGATYEIMGDPENIDMRNQYLKFKVKQVKGGA